MKKSLLLGLFFLATLFLHAQQTKPLTVDSIRTEVKWLEETIPQLASRKEKLMQAGIQRDSLLLKVEIKRKEVLDGLNELRATITEMEGMTQTKQSSKDLKELKKRLVEREKNFKKLDDDVTSLMAGKKEIEAEIPRIDELIAALREKLAALKLLINN